LTTRTTSSAAPAHTTSWALPVAKSISTWDPSTLGHKLDRLPRVILWDEAGMVPSEIFKAVLPYLERRGIQVIALLGEGQLNPFADKMGPADVVKASRAMNAAYAFQTAELVGIPPLAIPYQAAGFEALARELIAITRAEPTTADPDREIVDGWAEKLGLSRWYVWKTP